VIEVEIVPVKAEWIFNFLASDDEASENEGSNGSSRNSKPATRVESVCKSFGGGLNFSYPIVLINWNGKAAQYKRVTVHK
jgi:hypothetical protein